MNDSLGKLLLLLSHWLLIPDLLLLLGFTLFCLANLGGLAGEAMTRRRLRPRLAAFVRQVRRREAARIDPEEVPAEFGLPRLAFEELRAGSSTSTRARDKVVDDLQLRAERVLGRLHMGIRIGPMLGLIGTLIPLGPALQAMGEGHTRQLADGLIIAFSTPVMGMVVGGLCFFMHALRQRWYTQDLNDIEFLFAHLPAEVQQTPMEALSCESYAV
jgi:biopolymer transport protein ExbB/TolQ